MCKKVGHIEAKCVSNVFKCSKFGETHDAKLNCKPEKLKCSNCCGEHSCFYRGCPHFKEMRIKQLDEINQKNIKQVLRNFKFYQTFKPRPLQNSNTFFFSKSLKTYLKIYFNQFKLILLKKKNFLRSRKNIRGDPYKKN